MVAAALFTVAMELPVRNAAATIPPPDDPVASQPMSEVTHRAWKIDSVTFSAPGVAVVTMSAVQYGSLILTRQTSYRAVLRLVNGEWKADLTTPAPKYTPPADSDTSPRNPGRIPPQTHLVF